MTVKSTSLVSENAHLTQSPKSELVNYYVESTNSSIIINVNGIKDDLNVIMITLESTERGQPFLIKATCYSNSLILSPNEFYFGKISTLVPIQSFIIDKYHLVNKNYAIEIDFEPNKNNEFVNYSIEYIKKKLTYTNETEFEISSKKINGKRYIIAKNVSKKVFVITLLKESVDNEVNQFMIKYKFIQKESDLDEDITMKSSYIVSHDRSINSIVIDNSFVEIPKILYVKYHIFAYSSQQVSTDSFDSAYFKDSTYALSYASYNATLKAPSSIFNMIVNANGEQYKDIYFIIIVEYKKEKSNEVQYIALPPKQSSVDKEKITEASQITYGISNQIFNLTRSSVEDQYL